MIFESLWPLALLLAVPVVIILYLLKPKGRDYKISSTLLWDSLLKNQQSKTFLEKFIHNILMYLQILIILLLVFALMSPYIHRREENKENVILVFDTSGSMQHDAGNGRTRIGEAVEQAKKLIAASEDTAFSIISNDCMGTDLLAVGVKDKNSLYHVLDQIVCCDGPGGLQDAESVVETLRGSNEEDKKEASGTEVILFTDGNGAESAGNFSEFFDAKVFMMGEAVSNVSNNFLSYAETKTEKEDQKPAIICAASLTNYSAAEAFMEVSLYEGDILREIKQVTLGAGETTLCYFKELEWQGEALYSEITSVKFAGTGDQDSLAADNKAYVIPKHSVQADAVLVGSGNTYIEKAYQAATGKSLTKVESEHVLQEDTDTIRIYDAGEDGSKQEDVSGILFDSSRNAIDTVENIMITVTECDLTAGLSSFSVGVNETKVYEVPEWGRGFLWAGEQCAGYYGEHDGVKEVVVGFDIRESDFPLKAEFPIFISNAVQFLCDTSLLADDSYEAGETVLFHPQADFDVDTLKADTKKAGLYDVTAGDRTEQYVVRFATGSQSDGQVAAENLGTETSYSSRLVRKQLRNILLGLILILMAVEWILYVRQMRYRGRFYLAVRIVGTLLVLFALFGVTVNRRDDANTTIFLVDVSNSNAQNLTDMEAYLKDAIRKMPADNQYGIVTFGKNSLVEQFLVREDHFSQIMSLPDKTATNFEDALSRALTMIPKNGAGRVVILTDGKETKGGIANTASALLSGQIELLAMLYETEQGQDAYVEKVELPSYLYQGDAYSMTVTVDSNYETDAQIQIWMGTMQVKSYDVYLNRGVNQFQFSQEVTGENVESFEVRVKAVGDTCEENDSYHAYAVVDSVPKVLVISGMNEDGSQYGNMLYSANCNYDMVSAVNAPASLEELLEYKSVILENVYLSDLPKGFLENIETYVKDYGCGLVCCGGEDSYALGGYRESVLETVLPVDMELRGVDEIPTTAMIMVIDHSGSMSMDVEGGVTNLDLAIKATETAVDQMRSTDYVGVISFDDSFNWVVEPVQASDKDAIKEKIRTIADGGGTTIQPAVREAFNGVSKCEADIRHVILLTDGQGESRDYSEITKAYNDGGVTLSTVAVGEGSDAGLLERIAKECGGRFYYSDVASDIPKIFAQEVFLSGDTYLQNGEFGLSVNSGNEITRGLFADGWPMIYGYVSSTPKNTSNVLIASEKDDPVLTVMQYGLGHTVAWNSDVTNEWTAGYAGKEDYVQLWKRIIDYSVGNALIGEDAVDVVTAGGYTQVVYHAIDGIEQTKVEAVYTDPEGNTKTEPLHATAPGTYEAKLETDVTGIYNLSVRRIDDGEIVNAVTTAAAVQYSDEYKFDVGTSAFMDFVDRYGTLLDPEDNFWKQRKSESKEKYELTKWLILLAILWFVMDIAFRRFHFLPQDTKLYRMASRQVKMWRERSGGVSDAGRRGTAGYTVIDGNGSRVSTGGFYSGGAGIEEAVTDRVVTEGTVTERIVTGMEEPDNRKVKAGTQKKDRKKAGQKQEPQALDTSSLLKKKSQRNQ